MRIFDAALVCSGLLWVGLAAWAQAVGLPLWPFLSLLALLWLLSGLAYRLAAQIPPVILLRRVWLSAILFRTIAFLGPPLFEDDYFRYLWDGRVFAATGNPYTSTPFESFEDASLDPAFAAILSGINYPQLPTVYGPIAELGFLFSYSLSPASLWPWKLLCLLSELITLRWLSRLTGPRQLLLYATCPLLIHELGFNGHTEALLLPFLVLALRCQQALRSHPTALALAACAGVKLTAGLLAPILLWRSPRSAWLAFLGLVLVLYLPFGLPAFAGLQLMAQRWEFNSSFYALAAQYFTPQLAPFFCAANVFLAAVFNLLRGKSNSLATSAIRLLGLWLLLAPVVNPWYLALLVPFLLLENVDPLCQRFAWASLVLVSLSYATGLNLPGLSLGPYEHPSWLRPLEYGAIALAGLFPWVDSKLRPSPRHEALA